MFKKLILKFVWFIHDKCDNYIYNHDYLPKHADFSFWEERDFK